MGSLQINLLGTSFSIKASEDDAYLNSLLDYYKQIIEEIEKSGMMKNSMHISILAGIMLCDELYKEKSKTAKNSQITHSQDDKQAEKITLEMINKLNRILEETKGSNQ